MRVCVRVRAFTVHVCLFILEFTSVHSQVILNMCVCMCTFHEHTHTYVCAWRGGGRKSRLAGVMYVYVYVFVHLCACNLERESKMVKLYPTSWRPLRICYMHTVVHMAVWMPCTHTHKPISIHQCVHEYSCTCVCSSPLGNWIIKQTAGLAIHSHIQMYISKYINTTHTYPNVHRYVHQ